jgi:hypothetical protein
MIFKYFRRKNWRFLTQNKAKLGKNLIITLAFEKNAIFFAENRKKLSRGCQIFADMYLVSAYLDYDYNIVSWFFYRIVGGPGVRGALAQQGAEPDVSVGRRRQLPHRQDAGKDLISVRCKNYTALDIGKRRQT